MILADPFSEGGTVRVKHSILFGYLAGDLIRRTEKQETF